MKLIRISLYVGAVLSPAAAPCRSDTFEMRDGSAVHGKYAGGTATTVNVETPQGVLNVRTADIATVRFTPPPPPPAPAPAPALAPAPAPVPVPTATAPVSVPAGTVLTVRVDNQVSSKDRGGTKFSAKLVADLSAGGVIITRAGTTVIGQVEQAKQAGRLAGKSQLQLTLTGIDLGGMLVPIMTTDFAEAGQGSFRKTARNAGVGAVIGHQFDHGGGAGKGAAVGVGASLIREGDSVTVPVGAILEFRLTQPLTVTVR